MFYDLDIVGFRHIRITIIVELKHLTFRHFVTGFGEHFIDSLAAKFHNLAHGFGIEIVSNQHADLISPNFSSALTAPADVGIIDDIVMQERGGVDELHKTPELMVLAAGIATESGTEEQQQRSDTFAAAIEDMCGDGVDEGDAGIQVLVDPVFDAIQLGAVAVPHVRHCMNRGSERAVWHAADGRAAKGTKSRQSRGKTALSSA